MKIIEYKCNICGDKTKHLDAIKDNSIKAIYFTGNTKFEIKDVRAECDTHVCVRCLNQFKEQL